MHIYSLKYTKPVLWQQKGLWQNICKPEQYSYEKIYIWDKCMLNLGKGWPSLTEIKLEQHFNIIYIDLIWFGLWQSKIIELPAALPSQVT